MVVLPLLLLLATACRGFEDNEIPGANEEAGRPEELTPAREQVVSNATVMETYELAVQAYLDEDWDACIQAFRDLFYSYKKYKSTIIRCRRECRTETENNFESIFYENIEDIHFYEKKIKETLCLLKCNQQYREVAGKNALKRIPQKMEWKFILNDHYEYLHSCYYQRKYYQEAANAVFSYLIYHPNHKASQLSLAYYMSLPQVNNKTIHNLEAEPFVSEYTKGIDAYEKGHYAEAILRLESTLKSFIEAEEQCRFYCEGPYEQGWNPEFITSLSNHYVYGLNCKRRCSRLLSTLNGEYRSGFFENHYNYLQFAYYKTGDLRKACNAVASYLLFYPADETMLSNKEFYESLPMVTADYFLPREEAVAYVKRQEYEKRILLFVKEEFSALEKSIIESIDMNGHRIDEKEEDPKGSSIAYLKHISISEPKRSIYLVSDNETLGGKSRFQAEGLIGQDECDSIINLAQMTTWEGDGYDDYKSPHSEYERFDGVTIGRLAVLTYFGLLDPKLLRLLLQVAQIVKEGTEQVVQINERLYVTYTHLVCRTALPDSPLNRSDYSHQIHADNCLADYDGSCYSESPAYVWRDYSSILYLNDNFDGGNFIFVKDKNATVTESTVRPRCGRMLSFSSGANNLHGVTAVTKGRRCTLGLWFTMQKRFEDLDGKLAEAVLEKVEKKGREENVTAELKESLNNVDNYEKYKNLLISKLLESG